VKEATQLKSLDAGALQDTALLKLRTSDVMVAMFGSVDLACI
jgi:hypothetical protein